ncbi:MAG: cyclic nucleotide-binding/CBS domain-containing protein [Candidatus Bathyarchaeia archaeon]
MAERVTTQPTVKVREIMKFPILRVREDQSIAEAAKLMAEHGVGSIIITDEKDKPIGIITERDFITRIFAGKRFRAKIKTRDIMSKPVLTVEADAGIEEVAHRMNKLKVRRLIVTESGRMAGIVSSRDIVGVTPALAQVLTERARIGMPPNALKKRPLAGGNCDNCGQWADYLKQHEGRLLCEECLVEIEAEKP